MYLIKLLNNLNEVNYTMCLKLNGFSQMLISSSTNFQVINNGVVKLEKV